jgi:hypothetical protein
VATIDVKGVFNTVREFVFNRAGADDPNAEAKLARAEKVAEAQNRITLPLNTLKLVI